MKVTKEHIAHSKYANCLSILSCPNENPKDLRVDVDMLCGKCFVQWGGCNVPLYIILKGNKYRSIKKKSVSNQSCQRSTQNNFGMFSTRWEHNMIIIWWIGSLNNYFEERPCEQKENNKHGGKKRCMCWGWIVTEPGLVALIQQWSGEMTLNWRKNAKSQSRKVCSVVRQGRLVWKKKLPGTWLCFHYLLFTKSPSVAKSFLPVSWPGNPGRVLF